MKYLTRQAEVKPAGNRTFEMCFASESAFVVDGAEYILRCTDSSVRLGRLNSSAPLLLENDTSRQLGVVEYARIDADRKCRAVVRFGNATHAQEIFQDVLDGIRELVSVGYIVHASASAGTTPEGRNRILVTDWEPYQISIASVSTMADTGVGRAFQPTTNTRDLDLTTGKTMKNKNRLQIALENLANQTGAKILGSESAGTARYINSLPLSGADINLLDRVQVVPAQGIQLNVNHTKTMLLKDLILEQSAFLRAGAGLVVIEQHKMEGGIIGETDQFITVEAAAFETLAPVAEGQPDTELTGTATPFKANKFSMGEGATHGLQITIPRRQLKDIGEPLLEPLLLRSIALGVAKLIDRTIATAITATFTASPPVRFTPMAAASRGLDFNELRAVTDGTFCRAIEGKLFVNEIPAMLHGGAGAFVGAFNRWGVSLRPELSVLLSRPDLNGAVKATVWVSLEVLSTADSASAVWMANYNA